MFMNISCCLTSISYFYISAWVIDNESFPMLNSYECESGYLYDYNMYLDQYILLIPKCLGIYQNNEYKIMDLSSCVIHLSRKLVVFMNIKKHTQESGL